MHYIFTIVCIALITASTTASASTLDQNTRINTAQHESSEYQLAHRGGSGLYYGGYRGYQGYPLHRLWRPRCY